MDRRGFLVAGAAAAVAAACAKPQRELLDDFAGREIVLEPGGPRTTTTTVASENDDTGATVDDTVATPAPDPDGTPFDMPEADIPGLAFVAEATRSTVTAYADNALTQPIAEFANPIASGGPLAFLVEEFDGLDRFRVLLPTRPNGSSGWIDAADVELFRHNYAIRVELDRFTLTLFERDVAIFETTVAVARDNAPTPLGRYYTTELIRPIDPQSAYGAYAYGLSGYSETFEEFAGGPAQLGIHGTNDPDSLGTNVSSGCIRLHNNDIILLVEQIGLPIGVPVEVV